MKKAGLDRAAAKEARQSGEDEDGTWERGERGHYLLSKG